MKESEGPRFPKTGFPYNLTRWLVGEFLLHPLLNIQKHGLENLEIAKKTPVIFAYFPHTGHGDVLVALHALCESGITKIFIPGAEDYWFGNPWKVYFSSSIAPIFPQPRPSKNPGAGPSDVEEAMGLQVDLIKRGLSALMTPEGTRTNIPLEERRINSGFAGLALRTGSPVIPITIIGYDDVFPKGTAFPKPFKHPNRFDPDPRKCIDVVFGSPIFYPNLDNNTQNRRELIEATREVFIDTYTQYETYIQYLRKFH